MILYCFILSIVFSASPLSGSFPFSWFPVQSLFFTPKSLLFPPLLVVHGTARRNQGSTVFWCKKQGFRRKKQRLDGKPGKQETHWNRRRRDDNKENKTVEYHELNKKVNSSLYFYFIISQHRFLIEKKSCVREELSSLLIFTWWIIQFLLYWTKLP